jgi:hypothetical protein
VIRLDRLSISCQYIEISNHFFAPPDRLPGHLEWISLRGCVGFGRREREVPLGHADGVSQLVGDSVGDRLELLVVAGEFGLSSPRVGNVLEEERRPEAVGTELELAACHQQRSCSLGHRLFDEVRRLG